MQTLTIDTKGWSQTRINLLTAALIQVLKRRGITTTRVECVDNVCEIENPSEVVHVLPEELYAEMDVDAATRGEVVE